MKGHLDTEQLKSMKREELQAMAKDLGVNASGKTEEIIERIAAVEVGIPDESELTLEEKAIITEAAAAAEQQPQKGVRVECVQDYRDLQLKRIVRKGEQYEVTPERAAVLLEENLVKKV